MIADTATPFVPEGVSLWEAGTDADPKDKANRDFAKRVNDPLGFTPADCMFVFVTPRKWSGKAAWIEEKKQLGTWKDIVVYDSDNIEQWLETAPGVGAWFARYLGIRPSGIDDPENHWQGLSAIAQPMLQPGVFLASRSKEARTACGMVQRTTGRVGDREPVAGRSRRFRLRVPGESRGSPARCPRGTGGAGGNDRCMEAPHGFADRARHSSRNRGWPSNQRLWPVRCDEAIM